MPIFFQQDIDASTRLAIWHIEEDEAFFLRHVPLQQEITHPHKRLQHLAGRYLLQYLFPGFPLSLIRVADTRKPFLEDEAYHFSVSHSADFAAVIVSTGKRVGVDIETASEKIMRISGKFMSGPEKQLAQPDARFPTLIWSCKEALFKWYGKGGIDFRKHIVVEEVRANADGYTIRTCFKKNEDRIVGLHARFFGTLCLCYIATEAEV